MAETQATPRHWTRWLIPTWPTILTGLVLWALLFGLIAHFIIQLPTDRPIRPLGMAFAVGLLIIMSIGIFLGLAFAIPILRQRYWAGDVIACLLFAFLPMQIVPKLIGFIAAARGITFKG